MAKKTNKKLMEIAIETFQKHGKSALDIAKRSILQEKIEYKPICDALRYFSEEIWCDFQHPALLSLACEAVGGDPETVVNIGASITLLSGAVDIHDDIIDKSETKGSKLTVYGKFGNDIALLVGDALIFEGLSLLYEACENLSKNQRRKILKLLKNAFFEIGAGEAKETSFKGKHDLKPEEYLDVIGRKTAVAEACMLIGAILGGGKIKEINALGHYGRTLATLMTIRDEFIDVYEPDELKHRTENECLPLPILYAFQASEVKHKIIQILEKEKISENDAYEIVETIMKTKSVQDLKNNIKLQVKREIKSLGFIRNKKTLTELKLLLNAGIEDL